MRTVTKEGLDQSIPDLPVHAASGAGLDSASTNQALACLVRESAIHQRHPLRIDQSFVDSRFSERTRALGKLRCMVPLLALLGVSLPAHALDFAALLGCRDPAALVAAADRLRNEAAALSDARCKRVEASGQRAVECDLNRSIAVFGLPVNEFSIGSDSGRGARTRSVFRASAARVAQAAGTALRHDFVADADGIYRALIAGTPPVRVSVAPREDGASILLCELPATADSAEDILAGVDSARGGIAGRLSFPGGSLPPMRVCAIPRDPWLRTRCILTHEGQADYLITGLTPGDYDVASFALAGNSNGLVGAHARRLEDCAPNQSGCAGGVLVARRVRAGEVTTDVDPDRFYTTLPARFDVVKEPE